MFQCIIDSRPTLKIIVSYYINRPRATTYTLLNMKIFLINNELKNLREL